MKVTFPWFLSLLKKITGMDIIIPESQIKIQSISVGTH